MKSRDADVAWTRTCDGLGLPRVATLSADEASVLLKYMVAEVAAAPDCPARNCATHRARLGLRQLVTEGLGALDKALSPQTRRRVERALREDLLYCERIIDLAVSDLVSEPMAPEVCIALEARAELPEDGSRWTHGILFHAAPLITHEIYPLIADAFVHDSRVSGPFFRVVAVRGDWLIEGLAQRVLYYDGNSDRFIETSLTKPIGLDSIQFLALGERQMERHRCWAASQSCQQLNPWSASAAADDKHGLRLRWAAAGLEIPQGLLLQPGNRADAHAFLAASDEIVIKPNTGTEGDRVMYFRRTDAAVDEQLDMQLTSCWEWGPVLVEQRRDGVGWCDPDTGCVHSLALRLHVAHDGNHFIAESGYAQTGVDADHPASRGTGGRLMPLASVLQALICRADGRHIPFSADDLARLREVVELAAGAHEPLGLSGIDVVLDTDETGAVSPVLLELNPRPAGLAHARFLPGAGEGRCEAGVSLSMWDGIARTQSPAQSLGQTLAPITHPDAMEV